MQAVCDVVPERADEFAARYGGKPFTDYRSLLDSSEIDAVCIATPSGDHPRIGTDAANAGKHVVVEKPIGLTLREIDDFLAACRKAKVQLCVVHQNRFNPAIQRLRLALDRGWFGHLSHASVAVRWNRGADYYAQARWRGTWAQDGGVLMNQAVHAVDVFRWMMGEPENVAALTATRFHDIETEDVAGAVVRFRSGAIGLLEASNNVFPANWEETIAIFGDRGSAEVGGVALNRIERWEFRDSEAGESATASQPDPVSVYGHGHARLLAAVVEALETGGAMPVPGEDGRAAVELILAVYRSQELARAMTMPLREESERIRLARREGNAS